jgi:hypothetical protein
VGRNQKVQYIVAYGEIFFSFTCHAASKNVHFIHRSKYELYLWTPRDKRSRKIPSTVRFYPVYSVLQEERSRLAITANTTATPSLCILLLPGVVSRQDLDKTTETIREAAIRIPLHRSTRRNARSNSQRPIWLLLFTRSHTTVRSLANESA